MRVLVIGATGYIGAAVSDELRHAGHTVLGLARTAAAESALQARGDLAVSGSLEDPESLARAAAGAEAVIHAASVLSSPDPGAVDRQAVSALLSALKGSNKPFVYISGVWVYGDTRGRMLGELGPLRPPPLVAWRPAVEQMALEAKDQGIASMVFRPGMVFGRGGGALAGFFQQGREEGVVRYIGSGENYWSAVHADDLAQLCRRAIEEPAPGELFVACGGMPQQVKQIALAVAAACGVEGKVESVPLETARQRLGPVADCLAMDCRAASTKPARFFGWSVRHPSIFDEIFRGSYRV